MLDGVEVTLNVNGSVLALGPHGDVPCRLGRGDKAALHVRTARTDVYPVIVDGCKDVIPAKNWANGAVRHYKRVVPVKRVGGQLRTTYEDNNIRLIVLHENGFVVHEISLVGQNGMFWVCCQETYDAGLFQDHGQLVCPEFGTPTRNWPQLLEVLTHLVEDPGGLPPVSEYSEPKPLVVSALMPAHGGVVDYYDIANGVGAIQLRHGPTLRVHWTQTPERPGGMRYLLRGEHVLVGVQRTTDGSSGRPTAFTAQAEKVTLL